MKVFYALFLTILLLLTGCHSGTSIPSHQEISKMAHVSFLQNALDGEMDEATLQANLDSWKDLPSDQSLLLLGEICHLIETEQIDDHLLLGLLPYISDRIFVDITQEQAAAVLTNDTYCDLFRWMMVDLFGHGNPVTGDPCSEEWKDAMLITATNEENSDMLRIQAASSLQGSATAQAVLYRLQYGASQIGDQLYYLSQFAHDVTHNMWREYYEEATQQLKQS